MNSESASLFAEFINDNKIMLTILFFIPIITMIFSMIKLRKEYGGYLK
jgi:hypothetical protein